MRRRAYQPVLRLVGGGQPCPLNAGRQADDDRPDAYGWAAQGSWGRRIADVQSLPFTRIIMTEPWGSANRPAWLFAGLRGGSATLAACQAVRVARTRAAAAPPRDSGALASPCAPRRTHSPSPRAKA